MVTWDSHTYNIFYLYHGQVPIFLYSFSQVNQRDRDLPVFYWRRIGVKRKYLELDGVELVDENRRLRVGV